MIEELRLLAGPQVGKQNFDSYAISVLDFKNHSFESFANDELYFDLASLTKPLTLGIAYLDSPEIFDKEMLLLLNHRAGLPAWRRLSKSKWKEEVSEYQIKESDTDYSDLSALRLMLEIESKSGKSLKDICSSYWDEECLFWQELPLSAKCAISGERNGNDIHGVVHDDNAFVIDQFCSHAGLFATIDGISKTILNIKDKLFKEMQSGFGKHRFVYGWDTVIDQEKSLAGIGCSKKTFGHLGFTGTSVWIDMEKQIGHIILTNETKNSWYDRTRLNEFRKMIGEKVWKLTR